MKGAGRTKDPDNKASKWKKKKEKEQKRGTKKNHAYRELSRRAF